jgi:general secretion pathway protein G
MKGPISGAAPRAAAASHAAWLDARNVLRRRPARPPQGEALPHEAGFTLVELIVAFTILLALTAMAVPAARSQIRREHERELRNDLREMRAAIDKYKDQVDLGKIQMENDTFGYPKTLQILVDGVPVQGQLSSAGEQSKIRFLRRIPKDPMTGSAEWGFRSVQDDPTASSWGGQNVFDVHTKSTDKGSDGTPYADW